MSRREPEWEGGRVLGLVLLGSDPRWRWTRSGPFHAGEQLPADSQRSGAASPDRRWRY